jgi:hypothetical protein
MPNTEFIKHEIDKSGQCAPFHCSKFVTKAGCGITGQEDCVKPSMPGHAILSFTCRDDAGCKEMAPCKPYCDFDVARRGVDLPKGGECKECIPNDTSRSMVCKGELICNQFGVCDPDKRPGEPCYSNKDCEDEKVCERLAG